jgi:hypothetical protein
LGNALDPRGRAVAQAFVEAKNQDRSVIRLTLTDEDGRFVLPLLPPGTYEVTIARDGFLTQPISVQVPVSESVRITAPMKIAGSTETVQVHASVSELHLDSVTLGRVVDSGMIQGLPLATRNFTQIVDLSPGVSTGVNNAGELGPGGSGLAQIDAGNDGIFVHGSRSYDNSYDFDGIPVTDLQASNIASGGIPIPSPDAIEEFKVQTGLYNVTFGEHAGASVSLVTKSGTNEIHGSLFEFLRNNVLNANDFFRNVANQPRADLKQNQFGGTVGGPFLKDRLSYFGSYEGTRQVNGLAAGQARIGCSATVIMPPLTNDRSPQALGALFGGMSGAFGGVAVKSDGSNINPVALELLNFKLPDGSYLIPSPQVINPSLPLASQGLSTISTPCSYNADQVLANLDATLSPSSSLAARFIWSDGGMNVTFPGNGLNGNGNISGFPSDIDNRFVVLSASWTRLVAQQLLNQLRFGYTNTYGSTTAQAPFQWSDVGISAGTLSDQNSLPSLGIVGSINLASAFPRTFNQKRFYFSDLLTYTHSKHFIQMGGSLSRIHDDINIPGVGTLAEFLSWPDFLLGLDATQNGTDLFSNIFASFDISGLLGRKYRSWNGSLFVGDHFRASNTFALDVGLRYERLGQYGDALGRNASFDISQSDFNPPASGTLAGYVVASNYRYPIPAVVVRSSNESATLGKGQNGLAPRIGLAWQPTRWTSHVVIRAGYGIYFSQGTGQAFFQGVLGAPFSFGAANAGIANAEASFSHPFPEPFPGADFFPYFPAYSPTSNISITAVSPEFRPGMVQQFGLNSQVELAKNWLLEIGYVGQRGTHLQSFSSPNQALSASPANPVRGVVSNTLANISQRVPVQGVPADSLYMIASDGTSWYNGLEVSVSKRLSDGFEMLASYTFSKTLDSDGSNINGISAGNTLPRGNQDSAAQRWGRASFDRTHRFILSAIYALPSPSLGVPRVLFGGWSTSGVMTWQSGTALTIAYNNSTNVFGISEDRAELAPGCNKSTLVRGGSITSKLDGYFNTACFTTPPVVGADGIGTAFGDSGTGILDGPGQFSFDAAIMRRFLLSWPKEGSLLQIRAEAFNVLNHPQFSNPNTTFGSSSFGIISSTSVNPRVGQLPLKLVF